MKIIGIIFGVIVALVIALIVFFSFAPTGGVRLNNEMEDYALEYIEEHELVPSGEDLIAYYDVTLTLNGTEAAILTDKTLRYHKNGRNTAIAIVDIVNISHRRETLIGDILEIEGRSGQFMKIEIAPLNGGETFQRVLMRTWDGSRQ